MRIARSVLALILLATLYQCAHSVRQSQNPILGFYELRGSDNSGALAFTGSIQIISLEGSFLKGYCKVVREKTASENLAKDGPCEATLNGTEIDFDLAPQMSDGGILFTGKLEGEKITGVWMFDGFVGSPPQGPFQAIKRGP